MSLFIGKMFEKFRDDERVSETLTVVKDGYTR